MVRKAEESPVRRWDFIRGGELKPKVGMQPMVGYMNIQNRVSGGGNLTMEGGIPNALTQSMA